ncbi:hypothetical protein CPB83DRAFT_897316 [Crepidotus variabilis]|uniref:Uncharacterized protein n=1 Tax=Crepidotus variabilis TaxID=179855 RepID=A0A9P6JLS8_9AGAR|nr:hypothetical protein CPB83DRAFT_897316 [Crepidotus variabilis]
MDQTQEQVQHQRDTDNLLYGCLTIMAWDIIENLAEDVRLLTEHKIKFPPIVYFTSRISTLGFFIACSLDVREKCVGFAVTCQCLLAVHRGTTSLLLYLRVHALYRSNENIRSIFVFLFTMIIAFSMIYWLPRSNSGDSPDTTVKTPQIILLPVGGAKWQLLILFADALLICMLSGTIFRHMKLGLPGVLPRKGDLPLVPRPLHRTQYAEPPWRLPTDSQPKDDNAGAHVSTPAKSESAVRGDDIFIYHQLRSTTRRY